MNEIITDLEDDKFSSFSAKVKQSLEDKLRNHPVVSTAGDKIKQLDSVDMAFKEISDKLNTKEEL